jgi:hypothetical protein
VTRLLRWWRTRPWRGYRPDRVDRLDVAELVDSQWDGLNDGSRLVGVVLLGVRVDGSVRGGVHTLGKGIQDDVLRLAGLTALSRVTEDEPGEDKPREVN